MVYPFVSNLNPSTCGNLLLMAREKLSLSAKMGAVMGVERSVPDKLHIDPKAKTWNDLSNAEKKMLFSSALKSSTKNKKRLSK